MRGALLRWRRLLLRSLAGGVPVGLLLAAAARAEALLPELRFETEQHIFVFHEQIDVRDVWLLVQRLPLQGVLNRRLGCRGLEWPRQIEQLAKPLKAGIGFDRDPDKRDCQKLA